MSTVINFYVCLFCLFLSTGNVIRFISTLYWLCNCFSYWDSHNLYMTLAEMRSETTRAMQKKKKTIAEDNLVRGTECVTRARGPSPYNFHSRFRNWVSRNRNTSSPASAKAFCSVRVGPYSRCHLRTTELQSAQSTISGTYSVDVCSSRPQWRKSTVAGAPYQVNAPTRRNS